MDGVETHPQFVTSTPRHGGRRYAPMRFTEQGVAMLSSVLNSDRGIAHLPAARIQAARSLSSTNIGSHAVVEEGLRWIPEKADTACGGRVTHLLAPLDLDIGEPCASQFLVDQCDIVITVRRAGEESRRVVWEHRGHGVGDLIGNGACGLASAESCGYSTATCEP
jgi:hypothetical protein